MPHRPLHRQSRPLAFPVCLTARLLAAGVTTILGATSPAFAVQPERFEHTTESDFADGAFEGTVVTNLGDLKLAIAAETIGELPEDVTFVYDLATVGGTTYAAVGPEGRVLAWDSDGDAWEAFAAFEDAQVFALLARGDTLLAAVSGAASGIHLLNADGGADAIPLPDHVRYVWDLVAIGDLVVAATGPDGKVFAVDGVGTVSEVLDTAQANVLTLAAGRGPWAGQFFAGTDTDGLVYRIDADGLPFVVYDAPEPEVSALVVAADGTVYAGTADADQATPGRLEEPEEEEGGRPDVEASIDLDQLPVDPGDEPGIPDLPPAPEDLAAEGPAAARPDVAGPPLPDGAPDNADADRPIADPRNEPDPVTDAGGEADAGDEPASADEPDYDALREEVRRRIAAAAAGKDAGPAKSSAPTPTRRARADAGGEGGDTEGNAVYRVDPRGFVSEVFRESVMVLSLALTDDDGALLIATGNEGQLYRQDLAAGETAMVTELEGRQLLALVPDTSTDAEGGITVAAANPAGVHHLGGGRAEEGVYTSAALDAEQVSLWGTARLSVHLPAGTGLAFATRSGNVEDPEIAEGAGWSDWSETQTLAPANGGVAPLEATVDAPPARFLQYRVMLTASADDASDALSGPALTGLSLAYVTPNLRPRLSVLTAAYPDFPGVDEPASPTLTVEWEAEDPNDDRLAFTLEQRPATAGGGAGLPWQALADDTDDTSFEWDTRRVPDGYYELRIRAADAADNPGGMALSAARRSDPVLVDNAAPFLKGLQIVVQGRSAAVTGVAVDAHSPIHSVAYRLDEAEDESPLLPDDLIYDSTREVWSIKLSDLSPGPHLLSLRVTDLRGNRSFHARRFDVE